MVFRRLRTCQLIPMLMLISMILASCGGSSTPATQAPSESSQQSEQPTAAPAGQATESAPEPATQATETSAEPVEITQALATTSFNPDTATYTSLPQALGLWEEENLKVTLQPNAGSAQMAQVLISGQAQVAHGGTSSGLFVPAAAGAELISFYNKTTHLFQLPAVPEDSPIKSVKDFKGKTIGVQSLGSGTVPIIRGMIEEAGLNPDTDVTFVEVGLGAQAASALFMTKQVDILGLWDGQYANMENMEPNWRLRTIESPLTKKLGFQTAVIANRDYFQQNPDVLARFARAIAKATLFAQTNPEAAVRLHWQTYPEQKSQDVDEQTALEQAKRVLLARVENMRIDTLEPPREQWGYHEPAEIEAYYKLLRGSGLIPEDLNVSELYTNELIEEINNFDKAAWVEFAKNYQVQQ